MQTFTTHETSLHPEYHKTSKFSKDESPLNVVIRNNPHADSLPVINKGYETQDDKVNIVIPSRVSKREAVIPILGLKYRSSTFDNIARYAGPSPNPELHEKDSGDFYSDELRNSDLSSGKSEEHADIRIPGLTLDEKQDSVTNLEMIFDTKCSMTPKERLLKVLGNPEFTTSNKPQSIWSRFGRKDNRREKELYTLGYNEARQVFETYTKIRAENLNLKINISSLEENLKYSREQKISSKQDILDLRRKVRYNQINEENNKHIIKYDNYIYQLKVILEENEYLSDCVNYEKQVHEYKLEEAREREERYYMKLEDLRLSIMSNMTERIALQSASSNYDRIINKIQYYRGLISLTNSSISLASEMFTETQSYFHMSKEHNESKMSVISVLKTLQEEVDLTLQADTDLKKASSTDPKAIMPFTRSSNISALTPRMRHKRIGV